MDTVRNRNAPVEDTDDSWTNETLPLGIRRELLDRELRNLMARKRHAQASLSTDTRRLAGRPTEHPVGEGPPAGEHAS